MAVELLRWMRRASSGESGKEGGVVPEYDRGGMSAKGFAEWAGIKYTTFAWWLQERRRGRERSAEVEAATVQWVEAEVASEERSRAIPSLKIELGCGARMEVADRQGAALAAEVLRQLGDASFTGGLKVLVCLEACDMRKGFNGLSALVAERLGEKLKGGALFVFSNRRHTRLKGAVLDGTGCG